MRKLRALATILLLLSSSYLAQAEAPVSGCSPVKLGEELVFCVKAGVGSFSPSERAAAIMRRINSFSESNTFDPDSISVHEAEASSDIVVGDIIIVSLRNEDFDSVSWPSRPEMAKGVAARISSLIKVERERKTPQQLLHGIAYTVIATIALFLFLFALNRLFPRIYGIIRRSDGRYIRSVKVQNFEVLNAARIINVVEWAAKMFRVFITLLALYIYVPLVLSFFPWTANWAPKLFSYILDPLRTIMHVVIDFIPNLFFLVAIALVTRYVLKAVNFLFREIENGTLQFEGFFQEWASPTYKLVRVLIIAFAVVMAFPYLPGSSSPAFQGVSVFLGLLLSLGSSSAIANIVAGVVLTYMRPFKKMDRVKIADTTGDVIEKNLLVTRIRSIKNVEITIPNAMVLSSHIVNYSSDAAKDGLILHTTITIGYDVPWRQVHKLLQDAASRTDLLMPERPPFILQTALNDFYVAYEINAYTRSPNKMALIYSQMHQNIQDCFNEAGVEIMSPHYSALRDGNEVAIPAENRGSDYKIPGFRIGS